MKSMFCRLSTPEITPLKIWLCGLFFASSVFFESTSRVEEIAIWVLPRFFEFAYNYIKKRNWLDREIPGFLTVLFGLSIGIFCEVYKKNKSTVKSKYQTIGKRLIGDEPKISSVNTLGLRNKADDSAINSQRMINRNISTDSFHAPIFPGPGFIS